MSIQKNIPKRKVIFKTRKTLVRLIGAAISAVVVVGLSGGSLSQALKAGLIAGVTSFAFFEVGNFTPGAGNAFTADNFNPTAYAENVAGHALVGCAQSAASGGGCASGALSGSIGSAVTPLTNSLFPLAGSDLGQRIGGTILEATAGGFALTEFQFPAGTAPGIVSGPRIIP